MLISKSKYTYDGTDKDTKLATFNVVSQVAFEPDAGTENRPFAVKSVEPKEPREVTGMVVFDMEKGQRRLDEVVEVRRQA